MMDLASCSLLGSPESHQLAKPLSCKLHVSFGSLPGTLLERVKHVDSLGELVDVQDSMFQGCVHTDFPDARPDSSHGFPIKRFQALLNPPQLEPGQSLGVSRERSRVGAGRCQPLKWLISHGAVYKYQYIISTQIWGSRNKPLEQSVAFASRRSAPIR